MDKEPKFEAGKGLKTPVVKFREFDKGIAESEDLGYMSKVIDELLGSEGKELEFIGGIDQEDEAGEDVDTDFELDTFENYLASTGLNPGGRESFELLHLNGNENFIRYNLADSGGSSTMIFRIKK